MKFEWLVDLRWNELDIKFLIDIITGVVMFLLGVSWDWIAGARVAHHQGLGLWQVLWCAFWGLYVLLTWYYQEHYGV